MNPIKRSLKRNALRNIVEIKHAIKSNIQPFQELTFPITKGPDNIDRINPHDLFSHYTADIIRKDLIFIR